MPARRLPLGSRVLALLACLVALALLVAGCGSGGSGSSGTNGPDPAGVVPANAAVYVQATVRPSGDMRDGLDAAARKALQVQDPGAELRRLVDRGLAHSGLPGPPTYEHDVAPWLGDKVGLFVLPDRGAKPVAGFVADVEDRGALDKELSGLRAAGTLRAGGTSAGVSYDVTRRGEPVGVLGGLLVFASSQRAFDAAVAASRGSGLAGASRFGDAVGRVPDDALAFAYADPRALLDATDLRDVPARLRATLHRLAAGAPAVASLTANADEIAIEGSGSSALAGGASGRASDAQVSVGQLPGDSWLALATPPIGPLVQTALAASGVHDQAAAQVRAKLGLDLDRDLLAPLGGLGLFVRGESPLDIGAGALLQMTSPAAAQRLLTRAEAVVRAGAHLPTRPLTIGGARGFELQIPQSPQPIVVLAKGDRLAIGYAASSAQDLFAPQQRFDESSAGKAAIATLGDGYTATFVLIVPPLAALLRSLDELQVADLSSVLTHLNAFRSLAVGTKRDGDRTSVRIVAALR